MMRRILPLFLLMLAAAVSGADKAASQLHTAVFAGGCFWCMEKPYEELDGVVSAVSGYSGGHVPNPSYEQVSAGGTGHREVVQITYDPSRISYERLLEVFWHNIDPFDAAGQFCDHGMQYTAAIFYGTEDEKRAAEASRQRVEKQFGQPVVTKIIPSAEFYRAEDYHQDFYRTHSIKYRFYRWNCGRDARLKALWHEH